VFYSIQGRYEVALRDYKKGKYLLENRPGQLLPVGNTKDAVASKAAEKQQQRILEKVWKSIEKAMVEMRNVLVAQLQDTNRTVDEQEKTLELVFFFFWHLKIVTHFLTSHFHFLESFWSFSRMMILSGSILTVIIRLF